MGPSTKLQPNAVRKISRSLSAPSPEHAARVTTLSRQRSSAGHCVQSHLASRSGSHMFKVASFATMQSVPFLAARSRGQVQDFKAHFDALKSMLAYYDDQRVNAPRGKTTPEVQPEDWMLAQEIVNTLTTFPEFAQLAPALSNSIEALKPLLGQPGQARYSAWTAVGRTVKNFWPAGHQAPAASPAAQQRQVSAPEAAPQRKPTSSCQAACQDLADWSKGIQTVGNTQQIAWSDVRKRVNGIVSSPDFETHVSPDEQAVFTDLQKLNATDSGRSGRFKAWETVQKLVSQHTGSPPPSVGQFRTLLNRMPIGGVWMDADVKALIQMCNTERFNHAAWGAALGNQMWTVEVALKNNALNAGAVMERLLADLNQKFPPA